MSLVEETILKMIRTPEILYVEDDVLLGELFVRICKKVGCNVTWLRTGEEALEKLSSQSYDLVFIDLFLPGVNGVEVLRQLKALAPSTPAVIITGYPVSRLAEEALDLGVIGFIHKPFSPDVVRDCLRLFKIRVPKIPIYGTREHSSLSAAVAV